MPQIKCRLKIWKTCKFLYLISFSKWFITYTVIIYKRVTSPHLILVSTIGPSFLLDNVWRAQLNMWLKFFHSLLKTVYVKEYTPCCTVCMYICIIILLTWKFTKSGEDLHYLQKVGLIGKFYPTSNIFCLCMNFVIRMFKVL